MSLAALVGTVSALVGAPLAAMIFYLRAIREEQRSTHALLHRRVDHLADAVERVDRAIDDIRRAYTTKDEWLRETMLARRQLERLGEMLARLQADMENARALVGHFGRATHAIIDMADHLAGRTTAP
jgi:predicted RNase H-like nuclease (RuvC/YqgF family)